jgi:hypothetical protein
MIRRNNENEKMMENEKLRILSKVETRAKKEMVQQAETETEINH